jgi:hypothetical protein
MTPRSRPLRGLGLAAIAALTFAAGLGVGRWLGQAPAPASPATARQAALKPALDAAPTKAPGPAPRAAPASEPSASESPPGLAQSGEDPREIFGSVIDALRDDEIIAALATITDMSAEDVRDVRDPRALAQRMSEIAVSDLLGSPGNRPPGLGEVYFSNQSDPQDLGDSEKTGPFDGRKAIFARFSREDSRDDRVFMKWTRMKGPEIILFRRFPVSTNSEIAEVELRPESPLPPGLYKVAFYSDDDRMRPLASGHYSITPPTPSLGNSKD